MSGIIFGNRTTVFEGPAMEPDPVCVRWSAAKAAYEEDCRRRPRYDDGAPRRPWHELGDVAQQSWYRNPTAREYRTV